MRRSDAKKSVLLVVPILALGAEGAAVLGYESLKLGSGAGAAQFSALVGNQPPAQPSAGTVNPIQTRQLIYTVRHSKYAEIGTYINTIERHGNMTDVMTNGNVAVSVLGMTMYRQEIARHETWRGNRLVGFHGVTKENGKATVLNGMAEGDHFELMTPEGTKEAPADVRIANPWCPEAVEGDVMLTPDRGRLETVRLGGKEQTTLNIGHHQVRTEHIQVMRPGGKRHYDVWLDEAGAPVQFSVVGDDTLTFTLSG